MKLTQGTFSFLPDLTDEQIEMQLEYCIRKGWSIAIEHTDDPHPRNSLWEMWNLPMFDLTDPKAVMHELRECRAAFAEHYIKINGNDSTRGRETVGLSFLVQRPGVEPGFRLIRQEVQGRTVRYTIESRAAEPRSEAHEGNGHKR